MNHYVRRPCHHHPPSGKRRFYFNCEPKPYRKNMNHSVRRPRHHHPRSIHHYHPLWIHHHCPRCIHHHRPLTESMFDKYESRFLRLWLKYVCFQLYFFLDPSKKKTLLDIQNFPPALNYSGTGGP